MATAAGGSGSAKSAVRLRFCKDSNDLLYPWEDKARRVLVFKCRHCEYQEEAGEEAEDNCVYRHVIDHSAAEKTIILADVRADPTLPRTRETTCPKEGCENKEAVFFSTVTVEGMTLCVHLCRLAPAKCTCYGRVLIPSRLFRVLSQVLPVYSLCAPLAGRGIERFSLLPSGSGAVACQQENSSTRVPRYPGEDAHGCPAHLRKAVHGGSKQRPSPTRHAPVALATQH